MKAGSVIVKAMVTLPIEDITVENVLSVFETPPELAITLAQEFSDLLGIAAIATGRISVSVNSVWIQEPEEIPLWDG